MDTGVEPSQFPLLLFSAFETLNDLQSNCWLLHINCFAELMLIRCQNHSVRVLFCAQIFGQDERRELTTSEDTKHSYRAKLNLNYLFDINECIILYVVYWPVSGLQSNSLDSFLYFTSLDVLNEAPKMDCLAFVLRTYVMCNFFLLANGRHTLVWRLFYAISILWEHNMQTRHNFLHIRL